jgi:hypothetical protein
MHSCMNKQFFPAGNFDASKISGLNWWIASLDILHGHWGACHGGSLLARGTLIYEKNEFIDSVLNNFRSKSRQRNCRRPWKLKLDFNWSQRGCIDGEFIYHHFCWIFSWVYNSSNAMYLLLVSFGNYWNLFLLWPTSEKLATLL